MVINELWENWVRDQIEHLYCGHCGSINDVRAVDLIEHIRHLCKDCRKAILEWV